MTATQRTPHHRPHVLIVSDDPGLSAFLGEGLVYGGFWTSVIASALQTLEVFRLRGFDLMIVDAALGGYGAEELVRRLRAGGADQRMWSDLPIVVVSGSESEMTLEHATAIGADVVLYPPLELEDLVPALFRLIQVWREAHPDRPWADAVAQIRPDSSA